MHVRMQASVACALSFTRFTWALLAVPTSAFCVYMLRVLPNAPEFLLYGCCRA
jgi:hypothetical protein